MRNLFYLLAVALFTLISCNQEDKYEVRNAIKKATTRNACVWCQGTNPCDDGEDDCWATFVGRTSAGNAMIQCNCTETGGCVQKWVYCDEIGLAPADRTDLTEQEKNYFNSHDLLSDLAHDYAEGFPNYDDINKITASLTSDIENINEPHYVVIYSIEVDENEIEWVGYYNDGVEVIEYAATDGSELIYDDNNNTIIAASGITVNSTDLGVQVDLP